MELQTLCLAVQLLSWLLCQCHPQWLEEVISSYSGDDHAKDLIAKLSLASDAVPHYTLRDGLLRYKSRIWIGQNLQLQTKLIAAVHDSVLGGHSGVSVTYGRLKQLFAWHGMKSGCPAICLGVLCMSASQAGSFAFTWSLATLAGSGSGLVGNLHGFH